MNNFVDSQQTISDSSESEKEDGDARPRSKALSNTSSNTLVKSLSQTKSDVVESSVGLTYGNKEYQNGTIEMSSLVNYMQPITFRSFEISQSNLFI